MTVGALMPVRADNAWHHGWHCKDLFCQRFLKLESVMPPCSPVTCLGRMPARMQHAMCTATPGSIGAHTEIYVCTCVHKYMHMCVVLCAHHS